LGAFSAGSGDTPLLAVGLFIENDKPALFLLKGTAQLAAVLISVELRNALAI
jgi:hypothetical protein